MEALPFWVWAAATAGGVGAIGALFGWLLERGGVTWGRWVGLLAVTLGLGLIRTDGFKDYVSRLAITDAQMEDALNSASPEFWSYMKVAFPDDYRLVLEQMKQIVRSASDVEAAQQMVAGATVSLRRKYSKFAMYGDDVHLTEVLSTTLLLTRKLRDRDRLLCARFMIEGGMSLVGTPLMEEYATELDASAVPLFKSMRTGIDSPTMRAEPTEEDWIVVSDIMSGFGASEEDFASISSPSALDLNLCNAMLRMLDAIVQVPGAAGSGLRGSVVRDMAAG